MQTSPNRFMAALSAAITIGAGFARIPAKAYEDFRRKHGGKKSSGGRASVRINSPEYTGWKRMFGGLAVPKFFDLATGNGRVHKSSARGPRADTWHKRKRIQFCK
jgi:hypothetical protein